MAQTIQLVADFTPDVKAATDLRSFQYFVVQYGSNGVNIANDLVGTSGHFWILGNAPNSGQPCQLVGGPNIFKVVVNTTATRDRLLSAAASGFAGPGDVSSPALWLGWALTATNVGCGELVTVKVL